MAAILDFSKFNFSAEEIRAVKELIFDEVIESPELEMFATVYPGIIYDKEIGFVGEGGLVGVAAQGCDPVAQDYNTGTRIVKWHPKGWEILIHQCAKDLEDTAAVYSMKTGISINDFSSSDYMAIVVEVLTKSVKEFVIRLVWFSDVDAENYVPAAGGLPASGGNITPGVAVKYFNILNGFFKQMEVQITANAAQRVTIAENAAATYALQKLVPANVRDTYLPGLVYDADMILRGMDNGVIMCTQSVYDAYSKSLKGTSLAEMYVNLTEGIKVLTFDGIPLVPFKIWDKIIKAYFNTGTKLVNPHRAVYVTKDILAVGVDSTSSFGDMEIWYNRDERKVKMESQGKADAKLLNPALFQIAI